MEGAQDQLRNGCLPPANLARIRLNEPKSWYLGPNCSTFSGHPPALLPGHQDTPEVTPSMPLSL